MTSQQPASSEITSSEQVYADEQSVPHCDLTAKYLESITSTLSETTRNELAKFTEEYPVQFYTSFRPPDSAEDFTNLLKSPSLGEHPLSYNRMARGKVYVLPESRKVFSIYGPAATLWASGTVICDPSGNEVEPTKLPPVELIIQRLSRRSIALDSDAHFHFFNGLTPRQSENGKWALDHVKRDDLWSEEGSNLHLYIPLIHNMYDVDKAMEYSGIWLKPNIHHFACVRREETKGRAWGKQYMEEDLGRISRLTQSSPGNDLILLPNPTETSPGSSSTQRYPLPSVEWKWKTSRGEEQSVRVSRLPLQLSSIAPDNDLLTPDQVIQRSHEGWGSIVNSLFKETFTSSGAWVGSNELGRTKEVSHYGDRIKLNIFDARTRVPKCSMQKDSESDSRAVSRMQQMLQAHKEAEERARLESGETGWDLMDVPIRTRGDDKDDKDDEEMVIL